ncbi:MAG: VWA domain-containing protein [Candidatus Omnitrophica bacterium]|nr:VWA domain-containing protein [Candidatus Omnitrophota bacterium]
MTFAHPAVLILTVIAGAVIAVFILFAESRYRKSLSRFAERSVIGKISSPAIPAARKITAVVTIAVILFIGLALAEPQWGTDWKARRSKGMDIIFCLDTSKSMLARDSVPDRIGLAKNAIEGLVKKLKSDRVGLIAFAGEAFLECPLTTDYDEYLLILRSITVGSISTGGTSFVSMCEEAARAFKWGAAGDQKIVIVLSDGESTDSNVRDAAAIAKKNKITIFSIGIGTAQGIQVSSTDEKGKAITVTDAKGTPLIARLDESALKALSTETGGVYVPAGGNSEIVNFLYDREFKKYIQKEAEETLSRALINRFQIPLAMAVFLLFIDLLITTRRFDEIR